MEDFSSADLSGSSFREVKLRDASFHDVDLRGVRVSGADLSGAVLRGVDVPDVEIDSPWLFDGDHYLRVNGIDVRAFVDAELNKRFPGRELRGAGTPEGLRAAWEAVQRTWFATMERAAAMPDGTVDASVGGEWSLAQTLRHLVMATDVWLGRAILDEEQPFHPLGLPYDGYAEEGHDTSVFATEAPSYDAVLSARSDRVGKVGRFLAEVSPGLLAERRANPWDPDGPETVLSCLHTILDEEWEHHRYAVRDLDVISRKRSADQWNPAVIRR